MNVDQVRIDILSGSERILPRNVFFVFLMRCLRQLRPLTFAHGYVLLFSNSDVM